MFTGEGDLDEHNGRYCVTPDFPNGVYAYFATISDGFVESSGPFENFKITTISILSLVIHLSLNQMSLTSKMIHIKKYIILLQIDG